MLADNKVINNRPAPVCGVADVGLNPDDPPSFWLARTALMALLLLRPAMTTRAPSRAKANAIAGPMLELPPVTRASLPFTCTPRFGAGQRSNSPAARQGRPLQRCHASILDYQLRIPYHFPQMPVGILKVARVTAPERVASRPYDDGASAFRLLHNRIDF